MFKEISDRVKEDAPGCDRKTPEVEAFPPLEGGEDLDVEFEEVVDGNTEEDHHNDLQYRKVGHSSTKECQKIHRRHKE